MKRGTPDHPKMLDLAEAMYGYLCTDLKRELDFDLCQSLACGIMERLWHFTARYCPDGGIGKHSDLRIARAAGWNYDAQRLIDMLVQCRWLDRIDGFLYVHDWHIHSDEAADKWLSDKGLRYYSGQRPRRKNTGRDKVPTRSRQVGLPSREKSSQSESYPESESEPQSESESEPKPKAKAKPKPPGADALPELLRTKDFEEAWASWVQYRKERKQPLTPTGAVAQLKALAALGHDRAVAAIRHSIAQGWQGIYEPRPNGSHPDHDPRGNLALRERLLLQEAEHGDQD